MDTGTLLGIVGVSVPAIGSIIGIVINVRNSRKTDQQKLAAAAPDLAFARLEKSARYTDDQLVRLQEQFERMQERFDRLAAEHDALEAKYEQLKYDNQKLIEQAAEMRIKINELTIENKRLKRELRENS